MEENNQWLVPNQAARLCEINAGTFNYIIQFDEFKSYVIETEKKRLINPDVIPLIKDFYSTIKKQYDYYASSNEYIPAHFAAQMLNVTYPNLLNDIQSGKWEGKYVSVPKFIASKADGVDTGKNYFFIRSLFLENRYNTLNGIAENTKLISASQLRAYKRRGLLPQPDHLVETNLYDEEEIIKLITSLKTELKDKSQQNREIITAFDLLNNKQKNLLQSI